MKLVKCRFIENPYPHFQATFMSGLQKRQIKFGVPKKIDEISILEYILYPILVVSIIYLKYHKIDWL